MTVKVSVTRSVSETKDFEVEVAGDAFTATAQAEALSKAFELAANTNFNNPGSPEYDVNYMEEIRD